MSASVQCIRCGGNFADAELYIAHLDGRCVCADDLTVTDTDWDAFLGRLMHPSNGGDVA